MSNPNPIHKDALGNDPRLSWSFETWWNYMELDAEQIRAIFLEEVMPGQEDLLLKHFCIMAWLHAQGRCRFDDVEPRDNEPENPIIHGVEGDPEA